MAQSFTNNAKFLSALVQNGLSNALTRRGYAAAAAATAQSATRGTVTSLSTKMAPAKSSGESDKRVTTDKVSWVPDPVTGYYKPENIKQIDVAELRAALLGKKFNN